ncbi:MAG: hypothetical protein IT288_07405 [Bdellovibrionales bacterium]|nr:hypothetical protein [Bdellovibrionales bacterium]
MILSRRITVGLFFFIFAAPFAWAGTPRTQKSASGGEWFVTPHAAIGANSQQGTALMLGLDAGCCSGSDWRAGITGHYSMGDRPNDDRAQGAGLFVGYATRLGDMFVLHAREEVGYLDVRNPIEPEPTTGPTYVSVEGAASTTSVGITSFFTSHFALSFGYSYLVGLGDSELGKGRSGPTLGFYLGI